jgi:hypothetical protein
MMLGGIKSRASDAIANSTGGKIAAAIKEKHADAIAAHADDKAAKKAAKAGGSALFPNSISQPNKRK